MENIDDPVPVLDMAPLALTDSEEQQLLALFAAVSVDTIEQVSFRVAHAYDRKGYETFDSFYGPQNPSYRSSSDDIIVQVSMRIEPHVSSKATYEQVENLYTTVQVRAQEAAIEAAQQQVNAASSRLAEAQAQLEKLRGAQ